MKCIVKRGTVCTLRPVVVATALAVSAVSALAQSSTEQDLRSEIAAQKRRLEALEKRLNDAEAKSSQPAPASAPSGSIGGAIMAAPSTNPNQEAVRSTAPAGAMGFPKFLTPYLLIDTTISTVSNTTADGKRSLNYNVPWFSGSRWGLRGTLETDLGINALYKLEGEYVTTTGELDTAGLLFNRDAWVGLESDSLGRVTFGRQNTLARDFSQNYGDPYGTAQFTVEEGGWTNTNNFKQLIYYAGSATGTRYDRGIVWKKVFANGFSLGAGHQFTNQAYNTPLNTTSSLGAAYNGGKYNVSGFYNHANVNGLKHNALSVGGNYQLTEQLRLNAGYFHYKAEQAAVGDRSDNAVTFSGKYIVNPRWDFELGWQSMRANNAGYNGAGSSTLNAFADTSSVTAAGSGHRDTLYGSVFFHLSRFVEVYVAADYLRLNNGYRVAGTNGHSNQTEFAVGMRLKTF